MSASRSAPRSSPGIRIDARSSAIGSPATRPAPQPDPPLHPANPRAWPARDPRNRRQHSTSEDDGRAGTGGNHSCRIAVVACARTYAQLCITFHDSAARLRRSGNCCTRFSPGHIEPYRLIFACVGRMDHLVDCVQIIQLWRPPLSALCSSAAWTHARSWPALTRTVRFAAVWFLACAVPSWPRTVTVQGQQRCGDAVLLSLLAVRCPVSFLAAHDRAAGLIATTPGRPRPLPPQTCQVHRLA